jgi:hypothetical protein
MITGNHLRGILILIGLSVVGCAPFLERFGPTPGRSEPNASSAHPIPTPGCPYASVYLAVTANGSGKESRVAERVRLAYSESLSEHGFTVVGAPDEAYWSAFSMVRLSRRTDSTFAWTAYVMATQDLEGGIQSPVRFSAEGERATDLSGFMLLREVRLLDFDFQVERAAADTAGALLPHTFRMCVAWDTNSRVEVARHREGAARDAEQEAGDALEHLRDELKQEMTRVRRERTKESQQRRLAIEPGVPPGS